MSIGWDHSWDQTQVENIQKDNGALHYFNTIVMIIWHLIPSQSPLLLPSLGSLSPPEVDELLGQLIIMDITDHTYTHFFMHMHNTVWL